MARLIACRICGHAFETSGKGKRVYCSPACRRVSQNQCEARRRRNNPERVAAQVTASRKRHPKRIRDANRTRAEKVGTDTWLFPYRAFDKEDYSFITAYRQSLREVDTTPPSSVFVVKVA